MAFLLILDRLTPLERAVFLLKEVFDYEHGEISSIIGQSVPNCRQVLKRAKRRVSELRPRLQRAESSPTGLLESFLKATATGDMSGLLHLLTQDVVLRSDGGGKAIAVPNEVLGADRVSRGILGALGRLVPRSLVRKPAQINGAPGLINYLDGKPHSVLTIDTQHNRISAIFLVTNPEKLSHLPAL